MERAGGVILLDWAVREALRRKAKMEMQDDAVVVSAFCLFAFKSSDTQEFS